MAIPKVLLMKEGGKKKKKVPPKHPNHEVDVVRNSHEFIHRRGVIGNGRILNIQSKWGGKRRPVFSLMRSVDYYPP